MAFILIVLQCHFRIFKNIISHEPLEKVQKRLHLLKTVHGSPDKGAPVQAQSTVKAGSRRHSRLSLGSGGQEPAWKGRGEMQFSLNKQDEL
jgi:hypothetical protein